MSNIVPFRDLKAAQKSVTEIVSDTLNGRVKTKTREICSKDNDEITSGSLALSAIRSIESLVRNGRIKNFVFIGLDDQTRLFLTEIAVASTLKTDIFAFVGVTDTIKLELTERAQLTPALLLDGSVLDPYLEEKLQ